jgi:hypothetical protein
VNAAKKQPLDETSTCPWCSATVPVEASTCPSCGAALRDVVADEILGVTQVDLAATSRLARLKPPGRIAMWLGAERTTEDPELSGRIEPPSDEVRKEMLRLELAAIDAEIESKKQQAEAERKLPPEGAIQGGPDAPVSETPDAPMPGAPDAPDDTARDEPA